MRDRRTLCRIGSGAALALLALAVPAHARDTLGIFASWGAFRDPREARCYAIASGPRHAAAPRWQSFAAIGFWPRKGVRGQVNLRLSREQAPGARPVLTIGAAIFPLVGGAADVWAKDRQGDAAIVAAMRSGETMTVRSRARDGSSFTDRYVLRGAATAIDAAALGCARLR